MVLVTEKTLEECYVYYSSWQIQCCGEPFKVGDHVVWGARKAGRGCVTNGHKVSFIEEHHDILSLSIEGTVVSIEAEIVQLDENKHEHETYISLNEADGWESKPEPGDKSKSFCGYLVKMANVTCKPIVDEEGDEYKTIVPKV